MARGESPILRRSIHDSPRLRSSPGRNGSPSRSQLAEFELHRTIAQLSIATVEQQKVYNAQKTAFQEELDAQEEAKAVSQLSQIERAMASHDLAREQAQAVLQAHLDAEREKELQRMEEQKRREEEEKRRKEEAERRAKEEQERQVREQTEREEAAKRAEADRKRLEEERRRKAAEEAERQGKERQEQDRRKAEAQAEAQAQAQAHADQVAKDAKQREEEEAAKKAASKASSTPSTAPASAEQEHQSYLAIHKRLKKFRVEFWESCKSNKQYKSQVGEMRRAVRTAVGQLRVDGSQHNTVATKKILDIVNTALRDAFSPAVPVNDYLPSSQTLPDPSPTVPSLAIYVLSILAKTIISATINSCLDNPRAGEAPALLAVQIFAAPNATFPRPTPANPNNCVSLISILLAKYHASAPPLFGISGSEKTQKGRLGWRTTEDPATGQKAYVPEQQQYDRLVGLAAGYAAISLRNFSRSQKQNPYPPKHFWASLAYIINVPSEQVQVTHLLLLKSLLEGGVERIVQFWGATGVAALRQALVVFPARLPEGLRNHSTVKALEIMREKWAKDMKFHLT